MTTVLGEGENGGAASSVRPQMLVFPCHRFSTNSLWKIRRRLGSWARVVWESRSLGRWRDFRDDNRVGLARVWTAVALARPPAKTAAISSLHPKFTRHQNF